MFVLNDGKIAKLRASCDGCNESKVRCSQTKPQCGRCARQGIACIYGLSRRSHKTAPRVGASEAAIGSFVSGQIEQSAFLGSTDTGNASNSSSAPNSERATPAPTGGPTAVASDATGAFQDGETAPNGKSLPTSTDLMSDLGVSDWTFAEAISLDHTTNFELPFNHLYDMQAGNTTHSSSSSAGDSHFGLGITEEPHSPTKGGCNCRTLVVKQLLSLPTQFEEGSNTLETQFAQLKHAINVSEGCLNCNCISRDEMSIMTIGILIGRIIEGLEMFMTRANPLKSPTFSNPLDNSEESSPGNSGPRLSWGLLEIEPDEEAELKHHLWLIQIRKLQGVLKKLSVSVDQMKRSEGNGNSAKSMTYQCIHMWLMQKAELLRTNNAAGPLAGLLGNKHIQETEWQLRRSKDTTESHSWITDHRSQ
ncbi:hypothetical protein F4804DRAFT_305577 [Jackrogersella minutella]|nr:hypothetical protein F4804DRAFT_305577 [Jackrogersella minutella]